MKVYNVWVEVECIDEDEDEGVAEFKDRGSAIQYANFLCRSIG